MPNNHQEIFSRPEKPREFSLKNLLVYKNPQLDEYKRITKNIEASSGMLSSDVTYADSWLQAVLEINKGNKAGELLSEKLHDQILIDLGAGSPSSGHFSNPIMGRIAEILNVKMLISVDKHYPQYLPIDIYTDISEKIGAEQSSLTKYVTVKGDMLDFVSRLPSNYANFTINGIDKFLIDDIDYHKAIAQELKRATKSSGIIFGIDANSLSEIKEDENFKHHRIEEPFKKNSVDNYDFYIIEKIQTSEK